MTADLVVRLRAALDDHERIARAAAHRSPEWTQGDDPHDRCQVYAANGSAVVYRDGPTEDEAIHIALHDPAHVLRTVKAHQEILARYETALVARDAAVETVLAGATRLSLRIHEETVRLIASVYLPVPDTKEDTRP